MDYAAHVARICKIEDIEVVSHSSGPVKTAITYAVAMHEIGHILGPHQTGKNTRLDKEVGAWEWAQQHAIEWTDAMTATRARLLKTYLDWAARSKQAKRPTSDHPIHTMV